MECRPRKIWLYFPGRLISFVNDHSKAFIHKFCFLAVAKYIKLKKIYSKKAFVLSALVINIELCPALGFYSHSSRMGRNNLQQFILFVGHPNSVSAPPRLAGLQRLWGCLQREKKSPLLWFWQMFPINRVAVIESDGCAKHSSGC